MVELHLGDVSPESSRRVADVLGEALPNVSEGRLEVVGRVNQRSRKIDSGALAQNLGNDQWAVQLLNAQQLAKLVQSDLVEFREGVSTHENPVGNEIAIHVAAGVLGLGAGVAIAGTVLEFAGMSIGQQIDPEAMHIAHKLAAEGVDPSARNRIRETVTRTASDPGLSNAPAGNEPPAGAAVDRSYPGLGIER